MKNLKLSVAILLSFALGMAASQGIFKKETTREHKAVGQKMEGHHEEGQHEEGLHEEGHHEEESALSLDEKSQELIDLKTKTAQSKAFQKNIAVVGQIAQDAQSSVHVVSPVIGILKEAKAEIGSVVNNGDLLGVVLKVNGETTRHEIPAPISGTVIGAFAKVNDKVDTVSALYTISDLTQLWATFDVYEKDMADVKVGQMIKAYSVAYPQKSFEGEITFVSPRVDEHSRTIKIRALIRNPENTLKLGMFINADIIVESDIKSIVLPADSVYTIGGKKVVFAKTAADKFEVREVDVIDEDRKQLALSRGVKEGEEIVVQNGFLLKSEFLKSKMGEGCAE